MNAFAVLWKFRSDVRNTFSFIWYTYCHCAVYINMLIIQVEYVTGLKWTKVTNLRLQI